MFHLDGEAAIADAVLTRTPLWTDRRTETGPFDIIGDVHGCFDELTQLLTRLGYAPDALDAPDAPDAVGSAGTDGIWRHPEGRRMVFVGDLVDRGPQSVECARLVMDACAAGTAYCIPGNHDNKLMRALQGKKVQITHGLDKSLEQIEALPPDERTAFTERLIGFVDSLVSHLWLDGGNLAVAHAGLKEEMIGRASRAIKDFAMYGETTGETDAAGLPVRIDWAAHYRGKTLVVYGHTPVEKAVFRNNTANLDTGCVFGGSLTALRYPEREFVHVAARQAYAENPVVHRSLSTAETGEHPPADGSAAHGEVVPGPGDGAGNDLPDIADVLGRRTVETRLAGNVVLQEGNAAAALEVMSRFAAHPRWLIYLPPTMSPVETSSVSGYLERPEEAFRYFAGRGIGTVVCQVKHMGSRAVLVVCRTPETAQERFGAERGEQGIVLTRTGRPFFDDPALNEQIVAETARALESAGLWEELKTDWCCIDAEIMPWNAKAQALLREQYVPVAAAGVASVQAALDILEQTAARGIENAEGLAQHYAVRRSDLLAYREAYGRYCWSVEGASGLRIAPFHLLAVEGQVLTDRDHLWHIQTLGRLAASSPLFMATETRLVETADEASCAAAIAWWEEYTGQGGEGMVVKPLRFVPEAAEAGQTAEGRRGRTQPAVKVRGREYLRIIYGPEYTQEENLTRLRQRGLGAKRGLALREFALGLEALERFVRHEPLHRVHECVFGVLALESEPVDPRL
ncbi:MAG: polynucleotide kinase-phosphatase [Armatimonadaceae bacterium]